MEGVITWGEIAADNLGGTYSATYSLTEEVKSHAEASGEVSVVVRRLSRVIGEEVRACYRRIEGAGLPIQY